MKNFNPRHFLTLIGLIVFSIAIWALIILSLIDYAKYGDYPILTHDPKINADK